MSFIQAMYDLQSKMRILIISAQESRLRTQYENEFYDYYIQAIIIELVLTLTHSHKMLHASVTSDL